MLEEAVQERLCAVLSFGPGAAVANPPGQEMKSGIVVGKQREVEERAMSRSKVRWGVPAADDPSGAEVILLGFMLPDAGNLPHVVFAA